MNHNADESELTKPRTMEIVELDAAEEAAIAAIRRLGEALAATGSLAPTARFVAAGWRVSDDRRSLRYQAEYADV